jgi:carboxypeptidase T
VRRNSFARASASRTTAGNGRAFASFFFVVWRQRSVARLRGHVLAPRHPHIPHIELRKPVAQLAIVPFAEDTVPFTAPELLFAPRPPWVRPTGYNSRMARRVLARLQAHFLGRRPVARWLWLAWLSLAVGTALLCFAPASLTPRAPVRIAIRVQCAALTCPLVESLALDVWSEQRGPGLPLDIVVTDDTLPRLAAAAIPWQILVPDIDEAARLEAARLHDPTTARPADWFAEYHDYTEITAHLRELVELAPDRATLHAIGASIEGRPLWALRIGNAAAATPFLINGTQHAREWITAMVTTCIADRLLRGHDRDPALRDFVDRTTLWVVPVVNPDGYQHTWSGRRFWRKNRRGDHGVDLNRNFGVAWGGRGSSSNERSETYRGQYAFSEPESAAMRDLAKRERIAFHIDFHAFGQLVLYPWGHTTTPTKDRDRFAAIGDRIASAIFATHETRYTLMPSVDLYPASGVMSDWLYGDIDTLSYAIELRPKDGAGFVLPPDQIRPTCDEGLAAVLALRSAQD